MKLKNKLIIISLTIIVFLILFMVRKGPKIVVFDLDETLGHFSQLGLFWDGLETILDIKLDDKDMVTLLDTYPEFIRPNMIAILKYLKLQKQRGLCDKVMIYTNNQGPTTWANSIKNYFENKLNYELFDKTIGAFKVGSKRIEILRTTHDKTVNDFFKCTKLPKNSQICFLDDQYHPEMIGDNVYYIHLKPYKYTLFTDEMLERFFRCSLKKHIKNENRFRSDMNIHMKSYMVTYKSDEEHEVDKIISKKIIEHLQNFFSNNKHNKTIKKHENH